MTKREYRKKFRDHWQWLADNPARFKWDYPEFTHDDYPVNYCYACECAGFPKLHGDLSIVAWKKAAREACAKCPCDFWNVMALRPCEKSGPYRKWSYEDDDIERAKYAIEVKNCWK